MSREKGLLGFSSNFEPQYAQPFDARARVPTKNDLIDPVGWQAADGQQYLYDGLLVVVYADPDPAENGVYRLLDASTFTDPASWENLGTSGAGGDAGGDLSGTYPDPTVAQIQGVPVAVPAAAGARLVYDVTTASLVWYTIPVYDSLTAAIASQANQVIGERIIIFATPATDECGTYVVNSLTGVVEDYTKISDRTDTAGEVAIVDTGEHFNSDNVEDALQELGQALEDLPDPGGDLDGTLDDATVVGIQGAPVNQPSVSGARLVYDAAGNTLVWYTTPVYSSLTAAATAQENQIIGERIIVFATPATEECGTYELTTKTGDIGDYTKISDRTDTAEEVSIVDTGDLYDATEVEGALQEAAIRHRDLLTQGLALGGFLEPETTVSDAFDDGTRTLTLTPVGGSYAFYSEGAVHTKDTADAIQIPDAEGTHYVYYDESGDLVTTQAFTLDIITRYAIVAIIKWDAENQKQIYFGREYRHTTWMGGLTHARLHRVNGYSLAWGGELGGFTIGNGNDDSHARFSSGAAEAWDEDARFLIGARLATGDLPVYYRQGDDSLNIWRVFEGGAQASFPVRTDGTGRAYFNELDGTAWQLVEAGNNNFVLAFVVLTNDTDRHFAVIMGQDQYPNANTARNAVADAVNTLLTDGMPVEEFKFLGAVILQTSNSYTNTVKSRVIEVETGVPYLDLRGSVIGRQGVDTSGGDHNLLANLQGGQTDEYYHLTEEQHGLLTNTDTETDEIPSGAGPVEIGRVLAGSLLTTVEWAVTIYHEGAEQISRYNIIASVIGAEDPSLTVSGLGPDYGHDFTVGIEPGPPDYFALYVEPDGAGWKTIVTRQAVHRVGDEPGSGPEPTPTAASWEDTDSGLTGEWNDVATFDDGRVVIGGVSPAWTSGGPSPDFHSAYSDDGGATWETYIITPEDSNSLRHIASNGSVMYGLANHTMGSMLVVLPQAGTGWSEIETYGFSDMDLNAAFIDYVEPVVAGTTLTLWLLWDGLQLFADGDPSVGKDNMTSYGAPPNVGINDPWETTNPAYITIHGDLLVGLFINDSNHVIVASKNAGNPGGTWDVLGTVQFNWDSPLGLAITPYAWFANIENTIYKSLDGGATWDEQTEFSGLQEPFCYYANGVLVLGKNVSFDDGQTFEPALNTELIDAFPRLPKPGKISHSGTAFYTPRGTTSTDDTLPMAFKLSLL